MQTICKDICKQKVIGNFLGRERFYLRLSIANAVDDAFANEQA
jgi:hypothetical protein